MSPDVYPGKRMLSEDKVTRLETRASSSLVLPNSLKTFSLIAFSRLTTPDSQLTDLNVTEPDNAAMILEGDMAFLC